MPSSLYSVEIVRSNNGCDTVRMYIVHVHGERERESQEFCLLQRDPCFYSPFSLNFFLSVIAKYVN